MSSTWPLITYFYIIYTCFTFNHVSNTFPCFLRYLFNLKRNSVPLFVIISTAHLSIQHHLYWCISLLSIQIYCIMLSIHIYCYILSKSIIFLVNALSWTIYQSDHRWDIFYWIWGNSLYFSILQAAGIYIFPYFILYHTDIYLCITNSLYLTDIFYCIYRSYKIYNKLILLFSLQQKGILGQQIIIAQQLF